jgi:hypothetical protein
MPKNDPPLEFPIRGVPSGWRDRWDDADDHAELRDQAEAAEREEQCWRMEIEEERKWLVSRHGSR